MQAFTKCFSRVLERILLRQGWECAIFEVIDSFGQQITFPSFGEVRIRSFSSPIKRFARDFAFKSGQKLDFILQNCVLKLRVHLVAYM